MAKEKQRGTVADKGKKKITTTGKGQENSCSSVPVLRERNIGVVIRDEQDINLMRLRAVILQAKAGFFVYTALDVFPGDTTTYFAADKMSFDDAHDRTITIRYPNEYLNSLNPSGLPPFKLDLKVSCPIMLLRNITPKAGLCNGTRLMIVNCANSIIETQILTGDKFGDLVFIPRISLTPSSSKMPFEMTRRQFPIRLAYAMTINKSQGQSVNFVGIDLRTPVFSHGQLYVALSRCTFGDRTSVLLFNDVSRSTTNIVYPEVLL